MAINATTAKEHAKDPAVACCKFEAGTVISPENLEDPAIFADLEESGLLAIPGNCLAIEQVLGATLVKTIDALTPITPEYIDSPNAAGTIAAVPSIAAAVPANNNNVTIHIGEGKNISIAFPLGSVPFVAPDVPSGPSMPSKVLRSLKRRYFKINNAAFGDETKIEGQTLTLRCPEELCKEAIASEELVVDLKLDIITPDRYNEYSDTIMDVQPIACKEAGELGSGITRVLDGVVLMVTGTDENGVQIGEFGSSEGILEENIKWGRPGAPDKGDILIKTNVVIKAGANMERPGPLAAHKASDMIATEIRKALREAADNLCTHEEEFVQHSRPDKPRVVIVKEVMGQGAMHDNLILPTEPVGTMGARPNVDLGNLPVVLSPIEVLDGAIHALTCIGPASKECSRHYFREPLVMHALQDEEIDLVGVIFVGSPQANSEKFYVSKRLGMTIEAMRVDGAIVTTEGFGNNHIDFASHIEQIGERGIGVVGVTYSAVQGALVLGNKHMKHMIDVNKSEAGIENEILCYNTLCHEDAVRAMAMMKAVIAGEPVKAAEKSWTPAVVENNARAIEKQ
ncbi:MAG: D-proline reductase (dithiol) proprotein PrdA [Defluviitaleaceae bacterium]|nr:D-proline reductase (dithiol) proprotein PrdA [Defluviitaleaceae bacterium]